MFHCKLGYMKKRYKSVFLLMFIAVFLLIIFVLNSGISSAEPADEMSLLPEDWTYLMLGSEGKPIFPKALSADEINRVFPNNVAITLESKKKDVTFALPPSEGKKVVQKVLFRDIEAYLDFVKVHQEALKPLSLILTLHQDITIPADGAGFAEEKHALQGYKSGFVIFWDCTVRSEEGKQFTVSPDEAFQNSNLFYLREGKKVIIENLIIDGKGVARGIQVRHANSHAVLNGNVCIQNAWNSEQGGGVNTYPNTKLTIRNENNLIQNCSSEAGGGIFVTKGCETNIFNTRFENNRAEDIGGALFAAGNVSIKNCQFLENTAKISAGAIFSLPYSYSKNADTDSYKNLKIDKETVFKDNQADYAFQAPDNYKDFANLGFKRSSFTEQINPHTGDLLLPADSLLNNYDINYMRPEDDKPYPNKITLCKVNYKFASEDGKELPADLRGLLLTPSQWMLPNSLVIPPILEETERKVEGGRWIFKGWNPKGVQLSEEEFDFIGTWYFTKD